MDDMFQDFAQKIVAEAKETISTQGAPTGGASPKVLPCGCKSGGSKRGSRRSRMAGGNLVDYMQEVDNATNTLHIVS